MTAETLSNYSAKDLAQMAKRRGVHGWHAMRKDQLVRALVRLAAKQGRANGTAAASRRSTGAASAGRKPLGRVNVAPAKPQNGRPQNG
ncbi:MAG TPA: Rho termination factor N-terminal domain-containing protein, partial [Pirellulales bacterium]|nr:Rho termination factor N-terminal domain-containing protein [Pirellulales bacterium]